MKVKFYISALSLSLFLWTANVFSQAVRPEKVIKSIGFDVSKKLSDVHYKSAGYIDQTWKEKVIPNKEGFLEDFKKESTLKGADPVLQGNKLKASSASATIDKNFAGQVNTSGVAPPDTQGDVSLDYYMQMVNLSFQIWDKNGNSLLGPAPSSTLWDGFTGAWTGTNDGDPIVLYDKAAGRWIATQFSLPNYPSGPFYELVAVSTTNDPRGTWNRYAFEFTDMPDYPKFGIWTDGYYLTVNQFASRTMRFKGAAVCVLDRAAMISGSSSAQMLFFSLGTSYGSLLPADADGLTAPPAGSPNYLADLGTNSLHIWQAKIDWNNTSNSSVTLVNTLTTQPYSYSGITISQPGTTQTLDALATRLMYRLQYRNFGTYQVMLTNHSVNADGTGRAGVRWYELRNSGSGWSIYQQGTYAPADGNSRWMGSVAMNGNGDIGVGYSVSSSSTFPSIRFTGQTAANSGSGLLDVAETTIKAGALAQTGVNRWGDYSMMSVDPTDDKTFWYTSEYSGGGWIWQTQIASFSFAPTSVSKPVADFTATPLTVTTGQQVSFTDLSTNNPTSWSWIFTGATPSISSLQNPVVTYATAGNYTVSLTATNSAGSSTSTKTGYITVTNPTISYCISKGSNTSSEWINSVTLGSYTNPSGSNGGYGNFISTVIPLTSGTLTNLALSPGFSGKARTEYFKVWIDYNKDGDFLDAGENVFTANRQKVTVSGSIAIPAGLTGETRMRIAMKYGSAPTSCEQFTYGEVEDYTVSFSASGSNAPVANLSGTSITAPAAVSQPNNLKLEIYPNPASDLLNIKVSGAEKTVNIKVYNALGQIIDDFNLTDNQTTINLGKYKKGLFYIGIDDGVHNALKKFIKE